MKIATVCSGIGAPEKALKNLGIKYELSYFCEFDKYATKSYCAIHNEPETKNLGDLTKVDISLLPTNIDLLVGGTPCQDFSLAGKRAGGTIDSGTRSSLMWNFVEIIAETKPKVVLWENVPGCLTGKMRANFNKFVSALGGNGYKVYSEILNAKNFGIPQNRERVFVVAIRKDLDVDFQMPKGYDCGIRLKDILEKEVDKKYYLSKKAINYLIRDNGKFTQINGEISLTRTARHGNNGRGDFIIDNTNQLIELTQGQAQGNRVYDPNGVSVTLSANGGGMGAKTGLYIELNEKEKLCQYLIENNLVKENDVIRHSYSTYKSNNAATKNITSSENNMSPTLDTRCDCLGVVVKSDVIIKDFAPTQTTGCGSTTSSSTVLQICKNSNEQLQIRKLTPKECYRLMGFSDKDFENSHNAPTSDAQLYKQAGNSIVVNVLMAIFGQLYDIDWKPIVYGKWWKTEQERMEEMPLFQLLKQE